MSAGLLMAASGCVPEEATPANVNLRPVEFSLAGAIDHTAGQAEQYCPPPSQGGVSFIAKEWGGDEVRYTLTIANVNDERSAELVDHGSNERYVTTSGAGIDTDPVAGVARLDAELSKATGGPGSLHVKAVITCE